MTRPAIDPANIRRESTRHKQFMWWARNIRTGLILVTLMVGIASIDHLIP